MVTREQLIADLKLLGVKEGDTLFLRISYKAIGGIDGGPQVMIDALFDVIGSKGTLVAMVLPHKFNSLFRFLNRKEKRYLISDPPEITTGVIPKFLLKQRGVVYSRNRYMPFCAVGDKAEELMEKYTSKSILYKPMVDIAELDGKCLRIGGETLVGTTHISFTESLQSHHEYQIRIPGGLFYWSDSAKKWFWYDKLPSLFCPKGFKSFYDKYLYDRVVVGEGRVGNGNAVLTSMKKTLQLEGYYLHQYPNLLLCDDPHCVWCRTTYSFSDSSWIKFIEKEILFLIHNPNMSSLKRIYHVLLIRLLGVKCQ